jgi:hypothetical protein
MVSFFFLSFFSSCAWRSMCSMSQNAVPGKPKSSSYLFNAGGDEWRYSRCWRGRRRRIPRLPQLLEGRRARGPLRAHPRVSWFVSFPRPLVSPVFFWETATLLMVLVSRSQMDWRQGTSTAPAYTPSSSTPTRPPTSGRSEVASHTRSLPIPFSNLICFSFVAEVKLVR